MHDTCSTRPPHVLRMLVVLMVMKCTLAAGPFVITRMEPPSLQDLLEFDPEGAGQEAPSSMTSDTPHPPATDPKLMQMFQEEEEDARSQDKRSGLRAALAARGGRGLRAASGASVLGPGPGAGLGPHAVLGLGPHAALGPFDLGYDDTGIVMRRSQPANAPYLSVGVLSNVEQYFKGLREQLETLADDGQLPPGVPQQSAPPALHAQAYFHGLAREGPRPASTAAYLHALRSHRPSHRVRSFVEDPGPSELRGANSYDPALLWAGLGKR